MNIMVEKLNFAYKHNSVLRDVSFTASAGEFVSVLGQNGAGKTTLFRCILGLLKPDTGSILLDGLPAKNLSIKQRAEKIAYIPQAHEPSFNYSVLQTVLMGTNPTLSQFKTPGKAEHERVMQKLELLGIAHLLYRGYAQLSGGERQLVLIARALVQNSRFLIMDEPTANLDYGNQFRILSQIKNLSKQGYLILLSSHNPEHVQLFADKVLVLKNGTIDQYGPPDAILTPQLIQSIYGITVQQHLVEMPQGKVAVFVPFE